MHHFSKKEKESKDEGKASTTDRRRGLQQKCDKSRKPHRKKDALPKKTHPLKLMFRKHKQVLILSKKPHGSCGHALEEKKMAKIERDA